MPTKRFENFFRKQGFQYIAGVDEVGRGPLAGPVVAAAVILPKFFNLNGLDDSKKLKERDRLKLFPKIKKQALAVGVGIVDHAMIDKINIAQASLLAMSLALESLTPVPDILLVDGNCKLKTSAPQQCIIKGDSKSVSIAAASIIAKVIRDKIMREYDKVFPRYGFSKHKGYGTKLHLDNISRFGLCAIHRQSFNCEGSHSQTKIPLDLERPRLINF